MEGVTAAIVAYIFVCTFFPHMIKHRAQFYAGVFLMVLVMLANTLGAMFGGGGSFQHAVGAIGLLLQTVVFVLMIASTGGVSVKQLGKEFGHVIEVMRRGETEKEVIIKPRGGAREVIGGEEPPAPPRQEL